MERKELEAMTTPKLRELALEKHPEIKGVSGMKKEEIIEAVIAEEIRLGLRPKEAGEAVRKEPGVAELKARIRALKAHRDKALEAKDRAGLAQARAQIKRMKRRVRKLRAAS